MTATRGGVWPSHPLEDGAVAEGRTLYMGAAGVVWALSYLAAEGATPGDDRLLYWARALPSLYDAAPDTGSCVPSYFLGEAGVLLAALRADQRKDWVNRLFEVVESNIQNPTLEALWGAPGTVIAAQFAAELTGEERWRHAVLRNLDYLTKTWLRAESCDCDLWTQDLYGKTGPLLGAAHGFAGNVFAYFRAAHFLPKADAESVLRRAIRTLQGTAHIQDDVANWSVLPGAERFLVQWCHGAPGIITSFGRAPADEDLDDLLTKGGELIWRAGPLRKGSNLCHGTAGNGAAMLTLFSRTGDAKWLDRARRFAMHSIGQVAESRKTYGQGRYSLWTGDLGVAVYLWQCSNGISGMPSLDF